MEIKLGDVFLLYSFEELKELYSDLEEFEDYVNLPNRLQHSKGFRAISISKEYLGKKLIVFSMDYRDYSEPSLCLTTNTGYKEYFGQRMSGRLEWQNWFHIEDDRELLPFIKESKNIFDI